MFTVARLWQACTQKVLSYIPQKRVFAFNVGLLASSTVFSQGLIVATMPLLSRLYTPADYGILAVYGSMLGIFASVVSLSYERALPLPKEEQVAANVLGLCLVLLVITNSLISAGLWLFRTAIVQWTNTPAIQAYLWLLPISVVGLGIYQVFTYWTVRQQAFHHIAQTKVRQSIGQVISQVGLGLLGAKPIGLLIGNVVGQASGGGLLASQAWQHHSTLFRTISVAGMRDAARRYWRFPLFTSGSSLLNMSAFHIPALLVASLYGSQVAGWFLFSQRLISLPMVVVGSALSHVYLGEMAHRVRTQTASARALFYKTVGIMTLPALAIGAGAFFAPWLFQWVFGVAWKEAGIYTQILAPAFVLQFITAPVCNLHIFNRNEWMLAWDAGRLSSIIGVFVAAQHFVWIPTTFLMVYAGLLCFWYIVLVCLNILAIHIFDAQRDVSEDYT